MKKERGKRIYRKATPEERQRTSEFVNKLLKSYLRSNGVHANGWHC